MSDIELTTNMESPIHDEIENIRFDLIGWKMKDSENCPLTDVEVEVAIGEYKRFLALKIIHPNVNFAPTYLMDEVWHFHILDTKRYSLDCQRMLGKFLHHAPSYGPHETPDREGALSNSFERMTTLYREQFGHDPLTRMGSCSSACSGIDNFGPDPSCGDD